MFFDKEILFFKQNINSKEELFELLSNELVKSGNVKESFSDAIKAREKIFPTGLLVNGIGVAIPHTDVEHVNSSQIGFISLEKGVSFSEMTNAESVINVRLVFVLALKEPHEQLQMLQSLMGLFQNKNVIEKILELDDKKEFIKILRENGIS